MNKADLQACVASIGSLKNCGQTSSFPLFFAGVIPSSRSAGSPGRLATSPSSGWSLTGFPDKALACLILSWGHAVFQTQI